MAHIFQINTSNGGVPKLARLEDQLTELGLASDRQIHLNAHGGPERALCLYSLELILALQAEGHPVFPGALGENVTVAQADWSQFQPGACFQLGEQVRIEITRFTVPCNALIPFFKDGDYSRVGEGHFPGWSRVYCRVLTPGMIHIGDVVTQIGENQG